MILDGKVVDADRCRAKTISRKGHQIDVWYSGKKHDFGGNIQAVMRPGSWSFPVCPTWRVSIAFTFFDPDNQRTWVYVGEADLLPRRFQHYPTPGPRQQTNLRMNPVMLGALIEGGRVVVEMATQARAVAAGGGQTPLDLTWKAARVLVERAAEVGERLAGTPLLNR